MANPDSSPTPIPVAPFPPAGAALGSLTLPVTGTHIGALDGIRGLAIILVLFFHYGRSAIHLGFYNKFIALAEFGWVGVDLFFVLSGFLITGILYDARSSKNYLGNFYARRTLRIFPLYYLALLVVLTLAALWPSAGVWPSISSWWFVFYLSNIGTVIEAPLGPGILGHFWSLAIEEHFYLGWPLIVLLGTRRQLLFIAGCLLALSLSTRVILVLNNLVSVDTLYVLTPLRFDALAVGAICALAMRGPSGLPSLIRPAWIAMLAGGAAVIMIVALTRSVSYAHSAMHTIGFTFLAISFGGLLIVSLTFKLANMVFSNALLRWFGRYSYGLYVWHPIVNVLLFLTPLKNAVGVQGAVGSALYLLFALLLSIAVALASYHFWEQRFLAYKGRFH